MSPEASGCSGVPRVIRDLIRGVSVVTSVREAGVTSSEGGCAHRDTTDVTWLSPLLKSHLPALNIHPKLFPGAVPFYLVTL